MYPILIKFGFLTIYSYGVMVALGFLFGILLSLYLASKDKINIEKCLTLAMVVIVAAVVGARIFYVIEYWHIYQYALLDIFAVWEGGLVFLGGLAAAILAAMVYLKISKLPFWKVLDIMAPGAILGYGIGRMGCFFRGCCYGIESNLPWAIEFPHLHGARHPTQLYASITALIVCGLLYLFWRYKKYEGQVFIFGLLYYSVYRFLIEFFRINPTYYALSSAQWGSIIIFMIAVMIWFKRKNAV